MKQYLLPETGTFFKVEYHAYTRYYYFDELKEPING